MRFDRDSRHAPPVCDLHREREGVADCLLRVFGSARRDLESATVANGRVAARLTTDVTVKDVKKR